MAAYVAAVCNCANAAHVAASCGNGEAAVRQRFSPVFCAAYCAANLLAAVWQRFCHSVSRCEERCESAVAQAAV